MPRLRPDLALCALLATGLVSACSTAGGGLDQIAPTSIVEADDPELPDEVASVPTPSGLTAIAEVAGAAIDAQAGERADPVVASLSPSQTLVPTAALAASAYAGPTPNASPAAAILSSGTKVAARSPELDALIAHYANHHQIPEELLRRVVKRESTFNPAARNGPYWGLMQILPATARSMGYKGSPEGLLDAETNLKYAGKYLRGAYLVADGDHDQAVRFYSRGYYYDAKRKGLLGATGLGRDRRRM